MLRFLLARTGFPVNVIHGEEPFAEDEDGGYGPPRYLRPERVRLAAEALRATSYAQLISDVEPAELTSTEVYPLGWSEPASLEWSGGVPGTTASHSFSTLLPGQTTRCSSGWTDGPRQP
ncbi:hypothetical protein GCM10023097_01190 [Streptomyces collinus]